LGAREAASEEELTLTGTTTIKSRVLADDIWSALKEVTFYMPSDFSALQVTEIMYHPLRDEDGIDGDDFEFIELKNTGTNALNLSQVSFSDGIRFTFPQGSILQPLQFFIIAKDRSRFWQRYAFLPDGIYSDNLSNSGERIALQSPFGDEIVSLTYDDKDPWPVSADTAGYSLVPVRFNGNPDPDNADNWRASITVNGSPGTDDDGNWTPREDLQTVSDKFALGLNYPNPFNAGTTIRYAVSENAQINIDIFNVNGQKIKTLLDAQMSPGNYQVTWNGSNDQGIRVASGVYIYRMAIRLQNSVLTESRQMLYIK
jgi:hypothetical protein